MVLFLVIVAAAAVPLVDEIRTAFLANVALNSLILGVLGLGVLYNFRQVVTLAPEVAWIEHFRTSDEHSVVSLKREPRLLAPMATMIGEKKAGRLSLSAPSMRSLLDSIASRLDESRDISRYTIGLLVFLGLLGTFWGLLGTVASIRDVIGGISVNAGGDVGAMFSQLKSGLEQPLSGMGTAFSSSLFGLAGSLMLGYLDLQAGQAQNRFYNDLEEWLSSLTRLSSGALGAEGDQPVPAYVHALLEQTAESLEDLQRILARGEDSRIDSNKALVAMTEKLDTFTEHMRTQQVLMQKLAQTLAAPQAGGMDDATKAHIRNLETYAARLLEEQTKGRDEMIRQVRSEIKLLARTVAGGQES
jgi:hypothetical protein